MQKMLKKIIGAVGTVAIFTYGGVLSSALPVEAAVKCGPKPAAPAHWQIPANNKTVHWGYFSKGLTPQAVVHSGDFVTLETLTHHANDDADRMVNGDPGAARDPWMLPSRGAARERGLVFTS